MSMPNVFCDECDDVDYDAKYPPSENGELTHIICRACLDAIDNDEEGAEIAAEEALRDQGFTEEDYT